MKNIKISVIVPSYNAEAYLERALESLLRQTYRNLEIIIVDDCSTDRSYEIAKDYAQKDERIVVLCTPENSSALVARKLGVEAASGQYIMFMDPDDSFYPDACEVALKNILCKNVDILEFGTDIINCGNVDEGTIHYLEDFFEPIDRYMYGKEILKTSFEEKKLIWNLWNKIFKSELCKKSFEWVRNYKIYRYNDFYAFFIIAYFAESYYGIKEKLYHYNFGIGAYYTKYRTMDLKRYSKMVAPLSQVINGLREFLNQNSDTQWDAVLLGFEKNFFDESYSELLNIKDTALGEKCLELFVGGFGREKTYSFLFEKITELQKLRLKCENQEKQINKQQRHLNTQQNLIKEQESQLGEQKNKIAKQEVCLKEQQNEIEEQKSKISACLAANTELDDRLQSVTGSISFKLGRLITALPRKVRSLIKGKNKKS